MKVLETTQPVSDPFENPIEYLAVLGIEAELIAVIETPLDQAA